MLESESLHSEGTQDWCIVPQRCTLWFKDADGAEVSVVCNSAGDAARLCFTLAEGGARGARVTLLVHGCA